MREKKIKKFCLKIFKKQNFMYFFYSWTQTETLQVLIPSFTSENLKSLLIWTDFCPELSKYTQRKFGRPKQEIYHLKPCMFSMKKSIPYSNSWKILFSIFVHSLMTASLYPMWRSAGTPLSALTSTSYIEEKAWFFFHSFWTRSFDAFFNLG